MLEILSSLLDTSVLLPALVGLITLFLVRHILQVHSLPPGPFPLPIVGNLLMLRGKGNEFANVMMRLQDKHKDMFTIWLGSTPTVVVCDWDLCHEALVVKRNDFAGRMQRHSTEVFLRGNQDVVFSEFGPTWETLRKVLSTAVRKYVGSDNLAELCSDVCDMTVEEMIKVGKPVDANTYVYLIIYNIIASSAFGRRFDLEDPTFAQLKELNEVLNEKFGVGLPSDAVPLLEPFYKKRFDELHHLNGQVISFIEESFKYHRKTYQSGDIRDFTDAVIAAREEAEANNKYSLPHLTEQNMIHLLADLFQAGTDTTRIFMLWLFLIICDNPVIQRKMQAEIDLQIGSRLPNQQDKSNCHYVMAVLTETLRYRPVIDFTLEHKTTCDTELGGYKFPKDTSFLFYIRGPQYDRDYWDEPDKFKPERFLDADGKFLNTRITNYMPFGLGRRACPGEKLAIADTFLAITRLLQRHDFELEGGPGSASFEPQASQFGRDPAHYKLLAKKRNMNL